MDIEGNKSPITNQLVNPMAHGPSKYGFPIVFRWFRDFRAMGPENDWRSLGEPQQRQQGTGAPPKNVILGDFTIDVPNSHWLVDEKRGVEKIEGLPL